MEQINNNVAFVFEGNLNDLLVHYGNDEFDVKSSRLIEFGEIEGKNWDVQLTSYNKFSTKHKRFDKLLGKNVRITVEIIEK